YASLIEGFVALYEITLDEKWVMQAKKLMKYSFSHFLDVESGMFFFTSNENEKLITRNIEYRDNVIPASNSMMAKNLFWLGHFFANKNYLDKSKQMLKNVLPEINTYPSGFSNWLDLVLNFSYAFHEVVIVGNEYLQKRQMFFENYFPNVLFSGSGTVSNLPLLNNKFVNGQTVIYVCKNGNCQLPVAMVEDALDIIKN
ncbi:MAG: thioredoxin domain-containing protein, partial [Flavobacteriales bacterium]|nr:thioredoxin domain-containing protein [Flavobacteriales bacterium]